MRRYTLTRPDDWHIHLRDGAVLAHTVADAARYFGRVIVMPNLTPPVASVADAQAYRERIIKVMPPNAGFEPLMTLYLTDTTTSAMIREAAASPFIHACKLYPANATTNSASGVTSLPDLYPVFEVMQETGLVLSIHGEVTDSNVDIFDREAAFIDRHLGDITRQFPNLRVVFEHITTKEAADFVAGSGANVAATVTAHHLLFNRNDMLSGGMHPLYYCLPVLKRNTHQAALVAAATSGDPCFFLGTDSAPHPRSSKERVFGCAAGSYTAHAALELYALAFDSVGRLQTLEAFASHNGADFYRLPRNPDSVTLVERPWDVPLQLPLGDGRLVPIGAGTTLPWSVDRSTPPSTRPA